LNSVNPKPFSKNVTTPKEAELLVKESK
jgi:hypothetical protein